MIRSQMQLEKNVAEGAALLDTARKDWAKTFVWEGNLAGFDMGNGDRCILGNVFKRFALTYGHSTGWGAGKAALGLSNVAAVRLGFNISDDEDALDPDLYWRLITEAWQFEVLSRLSETKTHAARERFSDAARIFHETITRILHEEPS